MAARSLVFDHHRLDDSRRNEEEYKNHQKILAVRVRSAFPGALDHDQLVRKVTSALQSENYSRETTLTMTSLCSDEVCRHLEHAFALHYTTPHVSLGGLAGFPFSGLAAYQTAASHTPDGGHLLWIYGPHVGMSDEGKIGWMNRRGQSGPSLCCGSAMLATKAVLRKVASDEEFSTDPVIPFDQQAYVEHVLFQHRRRLERAVDRAKEVPLILLEEQKQQMEALLQSKRIHCKVALLGGIQINTSEANFFQPHSLDVYDGRSGGVAKSLPI